MVNVHVAIIVGQFQKNWFFDISIPLCFSTNFLATQNQSNITLGGPFHNQSFCSAVLSKV